MSQGPANISPQPPKPLRVALVAGAKTLGQLGPVVRHMVVGLLDEPMHVSLVCPDGADVGGIPAPPVEVIRYGRMQPGFLARRSLGQLAKGLTSSGVRVLHALDWTALGLTRRLAEKANLDYVLSVLALRPTLHLGDERCRAVLAASEPIRQKLLAGRGTRPDLVQLLRPAVHRAAKATCFMDPQHAPAIVAAGQLKNFHHFAAVLGSFAELRREQRQCAFFLVGAGPRESQLRRLAEKLDLMAELTFVQLQDAEQLAGIVKAADIFISPVPSDRVEVELLSAIAAGDPVVAAGVDACDFIINGQTALTFTAADAGELTGRLNALLDDRAWARSLAENALAHLREHHSPAAMAKQLADLYRGIAGRR